MNARLGIAAIALVSLGAGLALADQAGTLLSGKTITIISSGPVQMAKGPPVLMLKYRSAIPVSDMPALHREADEVWDRLAIGAEKGKYQQAVVSANGPEQGMIVKHSQSYNFVFQKQNGSWRALDFQSPQSAKLTEPMARDAMARFDAAVETKEMNAALLYLGDNWALTITYKGKTPRPPATQNRMQFATSTYQVLNKMKDFKHTRRIGKVTISPDGKQAQIESDETESGTMDGKALAMTEHSVDVLGIAGNSLVFTKTSSETTVQ